MVRVFGSVSLCLAALSLAAAQEPPRVVPPGQKSAASADEPKPEPIPVIKLAPGTPAKKTRALQYPLLPDALDLKPGNAVPMWLRATQAAANAKQKLTDKQYAWGSAAETPLKNFPRKEVRDFLANYAPALRYADQAARRERCDWEMPPFTIQQIQDLPLNDVQELRQIAQLLGLRFRLELSEGNFDEAVHTLQTGFALARCVGEGDTLIQQLVGIAITTIMLGHVEELMQTPGSPNLYWSLTTLPSPFINVPRSMRTELNTVYRSYPQLRELDRGLHKKPVDNREVEKLIDEMFRDLIALSGQKVQPWQARAMLAALAIKVYPDAKKFLAEQGYTKEEIEAMPALQAVVLFYFDQYNRTRDDILKWLGAPPWDALPQIERIARAARVNVLEQGGNFFLGLLLPAVAQTYRAQVRTEHFIARLRVAEALRLYADEHGGKAPEKLADIKDVPLPVDPFTGRSFDAFYRFQDGKGVLEVPPPAQLPNSLGRRYEVGK